MCVFHSCHGTRSSWAGPDSSGLPGLVKRITCVRRCAKQLPAPLLITKTQGVKSMKGPDGRRADWPRRSGRRKCGSIHSSAPKAAAMAVRRGWIVGEGCDMHVPVGVAVAGEQVCTAPLSTRATRHGTGKRGTVPHRRDYRVAHPDYPVVQVHLTELHRSGYLSIS